MLYEKKATYESYSNYYEIALKKQRTAEDFENTLMNMQNEIGEIRLKKVDLHWTYIDLRWKIVKNEAIFKDFGEMLGKMQNFKLEVEIIRRRLQSVQGILKGFL